MNSPGAGSVSTVLTHKGENLSSDSQDPQQVGHGTVRLFSPCSCGDMGDSGVGPSYGGIRSSGENRTEPASNKMEGDNQQQRLSSSDFHAHCSTHVPHPTHTKKIFKRMCKGPGGTRRLVREPKRSSRLHNLENPPLSSHISQM